MADIYDYTADTQEDATSVNEKPDRKKEKQHITLSTETETEKPELIVELSKVYDIDGEEVDSVDLRELENVTQNQQDKANALYRKNTKAVSVTPELTTEYAVVMTHVLTGIPLEAVKQFSFKDKIRLKNAIMNFLYSEG